MLKAKLKQRIEARIRAQQQGSTSESFEISDDESPVATMPSAMPSPAASQPEVSSSCELITRTAQLELAHSMKRPGRGKQVRRNMSKLSLAIARKKAQAPKVEKPKAKGKAKASPKAKVKTRAAAKCKAKAKAKPVCKIPGDAAVRSYHDLTKKFRQSREGDSFGEVVKDQRALLKEKIHVSKRFLCFLSGFWLVQVW